jgi:LAS superfamily LD-carboxypeptidase LdcB
LSVTTSRRQLLALAVALPLARLVVAAEEPQVVALRQWVRAGIERDASGAAVRIFDMDVSIAGDVLLPATQADALPDGYAPADLVSATANGIPATGSQLLRAIVVQDTRALIAAAADDGHDLYIGSGFRSQTYQDAVFAAQVRRWGDEDTANRYSARPGHSQHQLGTTIDFTNSFAAFRRSSAADWLRDNAHRFGFVLPYTPAAVGRTGYVDEPWHARWLGQSLASQLQSATYQDWTSFVADDVVALVRAEAGLDPASNRLAAHD